LIKYAHIFILFSGREHQETTGSNLTTDSKKLDITNFSNNLSAILNGDFEKTPAKYIENMIEPLESFLAYAYKQIKSGPEKHKKNT